MKITNMTAGDYVRYRLAAQTLYLGDNDEITIDLAARQRDVDVVIDIYSDDAGKLQEGQGKQYAASIIIPPRRYHKAQAQEFDMNGQQVTVEKDVADPIDLETVELKLWGFNKIQNIGGI